MNLTKVAKNKTARTNLASANQRAAYVAAKGHNHVLEMCVGPSLRQLERCYRWHGVQVQGNDIDSQWKEYYPQGKWLLGDALHLKEQYDLSAFDMLVFAPPLSRGCSGTREDSLMIEDVNPSFYDFVKNYNNIDKNIILTLPARSLATVKDKAQLYKFLSFLSENFWKYELIPLYCEKKKVRKYLDIYLEKF